MRLSLIVAMDRNRLIGAGKGLPWRLPADLKHFRRVTMGKPIVMGRRTHESIGRALPGRENIVVTSHPEAVAADCTAVPSLEAALRACPDAEEVIVIGGRGLYAEALPRADRIYLTEIEGAFEGDTWFPEWDETAWTETTREQYPAEEGNAHPWVFRIVEKRPA